MTLGGGWCSLVKSGFYATRIYQAKDSSLLVAFKLTLSLAGYLSWSSCAGGRLFGPP